MSNNVRISAGLVATLVVAVAVLLGTSDRGAGSAEAAGDGGTPVVRETSHRLTTAADGRVSVVEFLDFECEDCLAAYPFVEQMREQYHGQVTFVTRYSMPGHANGENAAVTVEAAAQQGRFEDMHHRRYETQTQWGERQDSQADDGLALGVEGAPTFFVNGEKVEVDTTDEFIALIDAALAR